VLYSVDLMLPAFALRQAHSVTTDDRDVFDRKEIIAFSSRVHDLWPRLLIHQDCLPTFEDIAAKIMMWEHNW
jgi:hypothetical protein